MRITRSVPGLGLLVVAGLAFWLGFVRPPVLAHGAGLSGGQATRGVRPNGGATPTPTSPPGGPAYRLYLPVVLKSTTPPPTPTSTHTATRTPTLTPTATLPAPAAVRIVVLSGTTTPEYVRLQNVGASAQDMTGWSIVSVVGSQTYVFPAGFVLSPQAAVDIQSYDGTVHNPPVSLLWTTIPFWNNNGDKAELFNQHGTRLSEACYGNACP